MQNNLVYASFGEQGRGEEFRKNNSKITSYQQFLIDGNF